MAESLDWDRLQELGWEDIGQADTPEPDQENVSLFPPDEWTGHLPIVPLDRYR